MPYGVFKVLHNKKANNVYIFSPTLNFDGLTVNIFLEWFSHHPFLALFAILEIIDDLMPTLKDETKKQKTDIIIPFR